MNTEPLVIERTFAAPIHKVWQALTDNAKMKEWYFDIAAFEPKLGFGFEFTGGSENKTYRHLCRITEIIPERKLSYTWKYDGYPGESLVTFELLPEGEHTRLKLTHSGLQSFPPDTSDFAITSFTAGWTHILDISLKGFLEKA